MTDHKFTGDDVIKAYELCFTPKGTNETCAKCPFHKIGLLCKIERDRAALALIKRQKAKIERLIKANNRDDLQHKYCNLIENVLVYSKSLEDYNKFRKSFKAEAIKEFAKRLVAMYENDKTYDRPNAHTLVVTVFRNIDNLVKEMTE